MDDIKDQAENVIAICIGKIHEKLHQLPADDPRREILLIVDKLQTLSGKDIMTMVEVITNSEEMKEFTESPLHELWRTKYLKLVFMGIMRY